MISILPTDVVAYYDEIVNLEGTDYLLTFRYNQREDCYYLDISTPDGVLLVAGVKCVANWPLLHKYADGRLPPGELTVRANTTAKDPAPGLGKIGENLPFTLIYLSQDQLP